VDYLDQIDLDALLSFRSTWKDGGLAKQKKQDRLIGFFWAGVRRGYRHRTGSDRIEMESMAGFTGHKSFIFLRLDVFDSDVFLRIPKAGRKFNQDGNDSQSRESSDLSDHPP
jgi:hypothetical protein